MLGSYLLHNDLHYNGLMIDWGLSPTFLQKRGSFFPKRGRFFRKRWRFSERCPTYYFISCDFHAIPSLDIASAQVLKLLPEEGNSRIIRIFVTLQAPLFLLAFGHFHKNIGAYPQFRVL